jgi:phosphate transport system substrate-binding protein
MRSCLLVAALLVSVPFSASLFAQVKVQGAGASFPSKVYQRWAETYAASNKVTVEYKATGSGDGIKQASERTVVFGGTDSPLKPEELTKRKLMQLPTAVGGVVPVVNLRGVAGNQIVLTGELLADIFAGKVARWNDPRIAALNPGVALPATTLQRVVRADKSGTSEGYSKYLALMSPSFKAEVGAGQLPKWPGQPITGDGNDGVVQALAATDGGIAYVSFDRVVRDKLTAVRLRNAAGKDVAASEAGFSAAIRESDLHKNGDDLASVLNQAGAASWPITLTTFVLFDAAPRKAADVDAALRFFYWAFMSGDRLVKGTGFAPLPTPVQAKLTNRFALIKPQDRAALTYYRQ